MSNLTNLQVKAMKLPGRYSDGNGLYLRIAPGGSKQWVQRIVVDDKRRDLGIGGYPAVTLAQARNLVKENRARVASGKAALGARERKAKAKPKTKTRPTFREMAEECRAELARILWTSERTGKIFQRRCNMYLYPEFGDWPIDKITQADIKRVCVAIAETTPQTARRVRIVAHQVFEYAKDERKLRDNPASKSLDKYLITKNTPPPENRKALPYAEVRGALDKVMVSPSDLTTKACYLFMVATAVRQGEARKAIWDEIDLSDPDNPKC